MKLLEIKNQLNNKQINVFSRNTVENMFNLNTPAATALLQRYKKQNYIKNPKKDLYYFTDNTPHPYHLAYKMYNPSYISFETALSFYGIIPEVTYSIVSATTKPSRTFEHENVVYLYKTIKMAAFTGYVKKDDYLIATPEKALADYLYFAARKGTTINDRLDLSKINFEKLDAYIKVYNNALLNKVYKNFRQ